MNKKKLIEALKDVPDDMEIFVDERKTDSTYGIVNGVYVKRVDFLDENFEVDYSHEAVILSEE